jgi:PIN domain nuclease of toxin-antitoxin system
MKYLLDTMAWMWSVGPTEKLGKLALEILSNGEEELYLSSASSWEVVIKTQLGKFELPEPPVTYIPKRLSAQGIRALSVTQGHTLKVYELPRHHADPFDRLIIAQAVVEEMTILTADRIFEKYPVKILWCGK